MDIVQSFSPFSFLKIICIVIRTKQTNLRSPTHNKQSWPSDFSMNCEYFDRSIVSKCTTTTKSTTHRIQWLVYFQYFSKHSKAKCQQPILDEHFDSFICRSIPSIFKLRRPNTNTNIRSNSFFYSIINRIE